MNKFLAALTSEDDQSSIHASALASGPVVSGCFPQLRLWMLRLLCECGTLYKEDVNLRKLIAQTHTLMPVKSEHDDLSGLMKEYSGMLKAHARKQVLVEGPLARNMERLASSLCMSQLERDLLVFMVLLQIYEPLEYLVDNSYSKTDSVRLPWQLGPVLGYGPLEIERALRPEGIIAKAGFGRTAFHGFPRGVSGALELDDKFLRLITSTEFKVDDFLEQAARPCLASELSLSDFDFMSEQRDLALRYLEALRDSGQSRGLLLLDGPPGVGKTQMARLLASSLGFDAYVINERDSKGLPATLGERTQYLHRCERIIENRKHPMVIFDEADAVLGTADLLGRFLGGAKAGIVGLLESAQLPMIWITNNAERLDPAIARRFDLTIRFGDLPRDVHEDMLKNSLPASISTDAWMNRLGRDSKVTPARIAQARKVAGLIAGNDGKEQVRLFQQILEENLNLKLDEVKPPANGRLPYRLDAVNASEDLPALIRGIQRAPNARLCLYGPPGTGKTGFVHHLAKELGMELAEFRASDLLGKYVGESEGNIRRMFEQENSSGNLLFIDEADSLFASRASARHQWQISQVNELLKGLEGFNGVFVASTNLMENLDSAVMRRLDFKIHFGWLERDARWRFFLDLAAQIGLKVRGAAARKARLALDDLDCLAPGDFGMLARRLSIQPNVTDAMSLAALLAQEMKLKPEAAVRSSIGFTARV